ncbi:MAG: hypothetical protein ACLRFJ_00405 [Alphaproteobacteria bacterium]
MIYGAIFLKHNRLSKQKQHDGINAFARKNNLKIDSFISYADMLNLDVIKPGDSVVFYAWSCIGNTRPQLKKTMNYFVNNKIFFYSATSEYYADKRFNFKQLADAFKLYEDIRFNFISNKSFEAVRHRIEHGIPAGRHKGTKNKTHVWDGHESEIVSMYAAGETMYSISKKLNLSNPAVKRCLVELNVIKE